MHDSDTLVEQLLNAGARGYPLKSDANRIVEAVSHHKSQTLLHQQSVRRTTEFFLAPPTLRRSLPIGTRCGQLIAEGYTNKQIGSCSNMSENRGIRELRPCASSTQLVAALFAMPSEQDCRSIVVHQSQIR